MAALLQTDEPEDGLLDRATNRQQAMVLEQSCFLAAEALCNVLTLFGGQDDAVERFVENVVL